MVPAGSRSHSRQACDGRQWNSSHRRPMKCSKGCGPRPSSDRCSRLNLFLVCLRFLLVLEQRGFRQTQHFARDELDAYPVNGSFSALMASADAAKPFSSVRRNVLAHTRDRPSATPCACDARAPAPGRSTSERSPCAADRTAPARCPAWSDSRKSTSTDLPPCRRAGLARRAGVMSRLRPGAAVLLQHRFELGQVAVLCRARHS
jgi:hypothetical protein